MTRVGRTYVKGTAAGAANDGYFGNGSDGALNVAAGQTFTIDVPSEDTQIIKNYSSVNIAAGATVKTSGRCNGVVWLVSGDFILNGTINMDKRAPLLNDNEAAATQELHVALCGALNGGKGGNGNAGGAASQTSSESAVVWSSWDSSKAGVGGQGFRLGGGYGGGGGGGSDAGGSCEPRPPIGTTIPYPSGRGVVFCGTGGSSYNSMASDHPYFYVGGAGPGGSGAFGIYNQYGVNGNAGDAIGGGAIWIFVMGQVTIGATGIISACGGNGAAGVHATPSHSGTGYTGGSTAYTGSGGGGGGGIIALVYSGGISNLGSLRAEGGSGGANIAAPFGSTKGEDGAIGVILVKSISDLLDL